MTTVDAITLFDREDGLRSMKLGRHEERTYFDDKDVKEEETEIVELETRVSKGTILTAWDDSDFPKRVREFFNVDGNGVESDDD